MTNIDEEFRKVATDVSRSKSNGSQASARHDFVSLSEQVAAAMVQAAEEQVAKAQEILNQTRKDADAFLTKVRDKDRELADMTDRIAALGEKVLEANREFHAAAVEDGGVERAR